MLLFGHRGDPAHAPENTIASFKKAIALGARAVEADVRRTADGVWVVFHDAKLNRTTGHPGVLGKINQGVLRSLDAGKWFSRKFKDERIPLLEDVLRLCRQKQVDLFLDVKVAGGERKLLAVLKRSGWSHRVIIGVGNPASLRRWRPLMDRQMLFWVTGFRAPITSRRIALARRCRADGLAVYKRWVTRTALQQVHDAGLKLYTWTIRTPADLKRLAGVQVDGLMSEVWPPPSI